MPLVTQLSEGVQPLVFPTDLSINTTTTTGVAGSSAATTTTTTPTQTTLEKQSANSAALREQSIDSHLSLSAITPPIKIEKLTEGSSGRSTPYHNKSGSVSGKLIMNDDDNVNDKSTSGKLNHFTEEEATALMLKAAAEKGSSGNLSDNSYSEENSVVAAAAAAAAFADAGLCNLNILNSISAMNSLIGANNGALSLSSSSGTTAGGSGNSNIVGGTNNSGIGHPCPECGRVYKLKSSLRNHQKWECGKEPQFQCPFCVYRAKQKMHIGRHMERMHKEKFVKLEDLKSYSSAAGSSGGGSGIGGDVAGTGPGSSSGHDDAVAELRQHFS